MTRYEQLSIKIQDCLDAAHRTKGFMRITWELNAQVLDGMRLSLTVVEAGRIVK